MSKHTPGPWVYHGDYSVRDSQSYSVATLNHLRDGPLIAAAPDLLAALEELVTRCDGAEGVRADGSNIQTIAAHAAIAKARGE